MGKELPTFEEIENVWDIPEDPEPAGEQPMVDDYPDKHKYDAAMNSWKNDCDQFKVDQAEYDRKVEILTWFLDKFMPLVVGLEYWNQDLRKKHLLTDKVFLPGDKSKEEKTLVTSSSEAFAVLTFRNCRSKWLNVHAWKKQHGESVEPPAYDAENPDTHKYYAIWSSSRAKSGEGGGWNDEGLVYYQAKKNDIKDWRAADEANGKTMVKFAHDLILEANKDSAINRKRAAAAAVAVRETAPARSFVQITYCDE